MQGKELKRVRKNLRMSQAELAEALGLSGTFVGLMERDDRAIEDRTALAVRQLFNERSRLSSNHRVTETPGDVHLRDATVLWDDEPQDGRRITVVGRGQDDQAFTSSFGAGDEDWAAADDIGRLLRLLAKFVELTVQEKIKPKEVHDAFSVIPEYRSCLHISMFRSGISVD